MCYVCCVTVPAPLVSINIMSNQTVGKSLALECSGIFVRGISSRVDIVWSSNSLMLKSIEGLNHSSTANDSVLYTDIYTIPQLSTADEGRVFLCEIFINASSLVRATDSILLNVTGKKSLALIIGI